MKKIKRTSFLPTLMCFCLSCFAQKKPEIPTDFFLRFSYTLPVGFNYNDSVQLKNEIITIAKNVIKIQSEARHNYSFNDNISLVNFLKSTVSPNTIMENYQQVIGDIDKCRTLSSTPAYVLTYGTIQHAYSMALLLLRGSKGTGAFTAAFRTALVREFNELNSEFRDDIVNLEKGKYNTGAVSLNWKKFIKLLEQVLNKPGSTMNYTEALSVLSQYNIYDLVKNYHTVIEGSLFKITPSRVREQQVMIQMRDGIRLNAFIYADLTNAKKLPALVSLSPYPSGNEAVQGNVFATNGYIYVCVYSRGRGKSEGKFIPYEEDARDYYDIIDWVSRQPWCDGQVATTGGSYIGFAQWQAIRRQYKHPALKAINPIASVGFGIDFPKYANQFNYYSLRWATYVTGKELNEALFNDTRFWNAKYYEHYKKRLPFSKLDSVAGFPNPIFQKWISHPNLDSYWKDILPSPGDYEAIDIPIFSLTGYYDGDQAGALYYYDNHQKYGSSRARDNHYLLIGPFNHGGVQWAPGPIQIGMEEIEKEAQIPIYKYLIQWFDWVLKGKQKPGFIKGKITYFETGNNSWKGTESFKAKTTDSLELFLTPAFVQNKKRKNIMSLDGKKPTVHSVIKYRHDIAMALDSAYLFATPKPFDDSLYLSSAHNLVFESSPLEKDIIISDKILTRLYMNLNVPDADFEIRIREIFPDGKDRALETSIERVRYRNGGDNPQVVKPGETFLLNFDDIYVHIKKIGKGSRLRLIFQSKNNPTREKNFGFGGEVSKEFTNGPRIIEAMIMTGDKYPSKLVIPYYTN